MEIEVKLPQPLEVSGPDPGSKQWLITRALLQNDNPYASEEDVGVKSHPKEDKTENTGGALPEERFHLSLPENVDQYTGAALDNAIQREEEEELPEDRFHRKDASSAYILEQRAKALQDKADKYERERSERVDDPNVEYIDFDKYRKEGNHSSGTGSKGEERDNPGLSILQAPASDNRIETNTSQDTEVTAFDMRSLSSSHWADLL